MIQVQSESQVLMDSHYERHASVQDIQDQLLQHIHQHMHHQEYPNFNNNHTFLNRFLGSCTAQGGSMFAAAGSGSGTERYSSPFGVLPLVEVDS